MDTAAAIISAVSASPSVVNASNHRMTDVVVNYTASDNLGGATCSLGVASNEPFNGTGDGDTAPDWLVLDAHRLQLRAERSGFGSRP